MALYSGIEAKQSPSGTPSMLIIDSLVPSSAAVTFVPVIGDGSDEDCCSICLDPFNSQNPPTVTACKHEYHLQCLLDWSQRSQECPICMQVMVLADPACQELLAAVGIERSKRSRRYVRPTLQDHEVNYEDDSVFSNAILQHFAFAPNTTHVVSRRQTSPVVNPSVGFPSVYVADAPAIPLQEECNSIRHVPAAPMEPELYLPLPSIADANSKTVDNRDGPLKHRIFFRPRPRDGPSRSNSSELHSISESVKAKLTSASARYKESFSKSTRGFKEKILASNTSVKELSKGVQREMSASISRVIERLDRSNIS